MRPLRPLPLVLVLLLSACGGPITASGRVVRPAEVPVRAFPQIVVVARDAPDARRLAGDIARHLRQGPSQVRRVHAEALPSLRDDLGPATGLLHLEVRLYGTSGTETQERTVLFCGGGGCGYRTLSLLVPVPVVEGRLVVRVEDRGGRELQRVELLEREGGTDIDAARPRLLTRLARQATGLLDPQQEDVSVRLMRLDHPEVRSGLALARAGRWTEGRRRLEAVEVASLPHEGDRARLLYNLAQALRFDASIAGEERLRRAERLLQEAWRLRPELRFLAALEEVRAQRRSVVELRSQAEALAHNRRLEGPPAVPVPPPSYQE